MSLIAKPARAVVPDSGRTGARIEKTPMTTAAAAARPAIQPHPRPLLPRGSLTRTPARMASLRPSGGAICLSLAATASSCARDCANHALQHGIVARHAQGVAERRVARIASVGAEGGEYELGLFDRHDALAPFECGNGSTLAPAVCTPSSAIRSWDLPRERRDMTVPIGTSSASAISW